jgi:hypothetical protein
MSVTAKLYNRILLIRIRKGLDTSLRYHQNDFRSERVMFLQLEEYLRRSKILLRVG